jgi:hypothetical protein
MPLEEDFKLCNKAIEDAIREDKYEIIRREEHIRYLQALRRLHALEQNLFMHAEIQKETETAKDDIKQH